MTRFLLDANAVIGALRTRDSPIGRRIRAEHPSDIAIPAIVAHELFYGAFRSARVAHNLALVEALRFETLSFDKEDARQAGWVRAMLSRQGVGIGPFDALIAGQAMARNLTLITHNNREFGRITGLKCEDWEV